MSNTDDNIADDSADSIETDVQDTSDENIKEDSSLEQSQEVEDNLIPRENEYLSAEDYVEEDHYETRPFVPGHVQFIKNETVESLEHVEGPGIAGNAKYVQAKMKELLRNQSKIERIL